MKPLYIIGAGGFGREVAWLVGEYFREVRYRSSCPETAGKQLRRAA